MEIPVQCGGATEKPFCTHQSDKWPRRRRIQEIAAISSRGLPSGEDAMALPPTPASGVCDSMSCCQSSFAGLGVPTQN
eukprot:5802674-Prorocentrum_lima.AAC.1